MSLRPPVHVVYGGAHLFRAATARKMGEIAIEALDAHAPGAAQFGAIVGTPEALMSRVDAGVRAKLAREPVEDFRIDFEDGYGIRGDAEEDRHADEAADEIARGARAATLPPRLGIRVKPLDRLSAPRALRTLDRVVSRVARALDATLPSPFVVTLPKVTSADDVRTLVEAVERVERAASLEPGAIGIELMIETPEAILDRDGRCPVASWVGAAAGRCTSVHFGPFDYTAALGVTAAYQGVSHPACDYARQTLQVALAATGVRIVDGPTHILPVPRHRQALGGPPLTPDERAENAHAVREAWHLHARHIERALQHGFYQGWDLHPAQLPARFAVVLAFALRHLDEARARLDGFEARARQATLAGVTFDDAATVRGVENFLRQFAEVATW